MPDISMCQNVRCPSRTTCRRSADSGTVPDAYAQAYSVFIHSHSTGRCENYWPIKESEDDKSND